MDHGGRKERPKGSVFCDVEAYVSCRGYVGIPQSARPKAAKQGGTARLFFSDSSLTNICQGRVFFSSLRQEVKMYYPTLKEARALAQSGPYGQSP